MAALVAASLLLVSACAQTPGTHRQHRPVAWEYVGERGRVLVVAVGGDSCTTGRVTARAREDDGAVRVLAVSHERVVGACGGESFLEKETLHLAAPLGTRRLTGCRHAVADCRQAAADVPDWRPPPSPTG